MRDYYVPMTQEEEWEAEEKYYVQHWETQEDTGEDTCEGELDLCGDHYICEICGDIVDGWIVEEIIRKRTYRR